MRSIWTGVINFGLVTIPVKLYTATEQKDVHFRLVHKKDGAPIVEKRFCSKENKEVAWEDTARGYEVRKGEFVVLDADEIEEKKPERTHTIEIGDFVELEEIDPILLREDVLSRADRRRRQAVQPAPARPRGKRPGGRRQGHHPDQGAAGDAACLRLDAGARDDVLAGRDPIN